MYGTGKMAPKRKKKGKSGRKSKSKKRTSRLRIDILIVYELLNGFIPRTTSNVTRVDNERF